MGYTIKFYVYLWVVSYDMTQLRPSYNVQLTTSYENSIYLYVGFYSWINSIHLVISV